MKIKKLLAVAALLSTVSAPLSILHAQGLLTPPGAPAPTMKSLDQIEPRTPISSAPFTITNSGSYYLTTNLTVTGGVAININTNGVTLDLNGFTISSTAPSVIGTAILLNNPAGNSHITIFNGHILSGVTNNGSGSYNGPGFRYGIYYSSAIPTNVRVTGVSVSGCESDGIYLYLGNSTVVENCTAQTIGTYGILAAVVKGSSASDCGSVAIDGDSVSDSQGQAAGSGGCGVLAATALNCYGTSTGSAGDGMYIVFTAQNCYGNTVVSGTGIFATGATATSCYGSAPTGGVGISANVANGCVSLVNGSESDTSITFKYNMP